MLNSVFISEKELKITVDDTKHGTCNTW